MGINTISGGLSLRTYARENDLLDLGPIWEGFERPKAVSESKNLVLDLFG